LKSLEQEKTMENKIDRQAFLQSLIVPPGKQISLQKDYNPGFKPDYITKEDANTLLQNGIEKMAEFQDKLYAQDTYALLLNLQAMDAAGKDGTIKHVMSGLNPQGCQVFSFKIPSAEELDHDYLWRYCKALPERGRIGIFNRSYYEELLVVRVHEELLDRQKLPPDAKTKKIWRRRFEEINNFEQYLVNNGIIVLKIFLYVSKDEQKKRFLERIDRPEKNWKFSQNDVKERGFWDDYMKAYEDIFNHTSTEWAPWYIIPADRKWFTRLAVGVVIYNTLESLGLQYPTVTEEHRRSLGSAKELLENEV
jgi:PPK2 family polyphosphate:nucleotide phosphotransferase